MKTLKKFLLSLLALVFCLSLAACTGNGDREESTADGTGSEISAAEAGIVAHGKFFQEDFPDNAEFDEWFELAREREQLTNALIYSKDDSDGLWHCRLYVGSFTDGDSVAFGSESAEGIILIRHTAQDESSLGSAYIFYFTVDRNEEPEFEFYQNDSFEGMLVTHAESSMTK